MATLTQVFLRPPAYAPETAGAVIDWWESRRLIYNVGVGAAGIVTLGIMNVMFALPPEPEPMPWQLSVIGPLVYGTAANFCYSVGWGAELLLRRWLGPNTGEIGAALFRYGFACSVGLTLFPAGIATLAWFARILD